MSEQDPVSPRKDIPVLEAMNIGMLLDKAIHLYTRNFGLLIAIYSIPWAVTAAVGAIVRDDSLSPGLRFLRILVSTVLNLVVSGIAGGAMSVVVSSRYLGTDISFRRAYGAALRKAWTLAGCMLLSGLFIILGFLGLVVPGIFFVVFFFLLSPTIMLEDIRGARNLKRSRLLTKGYRWRTLFLILVSYLPIFVFVPIFIAIPKLGQTGRISPLGTILLAVLSSSVSLFLGPFIAIVATLIYYNQRIRTEGFDLAFLAQAMSRRSE